MVCSICNNEFEARPAEHVTELKEILRKEDWVTELSVIYNGYDETRIILKSDSQCSDCESSRGVCE